MSAINSLSYPMHSTTYLFSMKYMKSNSLVKHPFLIKNIQTKLTCVIIYFLQSIYGNKKSNKLKDFLVIGK